MSEAAPQLRISDPRASESEGDLVALLEERLTSLVERHREALKTIEELNTQLEDKRAQFSDLSRRLERGETVRDEARARLEALMGRLARIEAAVSGREDDAVRDGS